MILSEGWNLTMLDVQNSQTAALENRQLVWVGVLGHPYGTKGNIKLRSFCLDPGNIASFSCLYSESGSTNYRLEGLIEAGEEFVARIHGVNSREQAEQLKGTKLFANREEFPELEDNEYYYSDLQNLLAMDSDGKCIGHVISMNNFGAGDLMELFLEDSGNKVFIPFNKENIVSVEIPLGYLVVENVENYL